MSKLTRDTPPLEGGPVEHRLARLLDSSFMQHVVPHLAPETLHQLVRYRGLDACAEIVTAATPAQLTSLLDLDLWRRTQTGRDEQFDVDRFGEWLEVLIDTGDAVAARAIAAMNHSLVVAGLARYVRVFDPGIFEPTAQTDDETIDFYDAMREGDAVDGRDDRLTCEIGGYIVRGRRSDGWDAVIALFVALETEQPDCFHALMRGCRALSNSNPEESGFHDLLLEPEQHLHDVALERDQRRSQQGYATAADARAFLQMARQPRSTAAMTSNPIAAAYFRAAEEEISSPTEGASVDTPRIGDVPAAIDAVVDLLVEAGVMPQPPRALLAAAPEDPRAVKLAHLKLAMEHLLHQDEGAYLARSRELAFLANTLLAGCAVQSRPFTPQEASDAAACISNLGLECWPDAGAERAPLLANHDLVAAFEVGWSVLYRDVTLFTVDQLLSVLPNLGHIDAETRLALLGFQRKLAKQRDAGTPWLARGAADAIASLDQTAWVSVIGLLDECPILPAALTAILEGSTTPVSPTAFTFVSTKEQIAGVQRFMALLPELLTGGEQWPD